MTSSAMLTDVPLAAISSNDLFLSNSVTFPLSPPASPNKVEKVKWQGNPRRKEARCSTKNITKSILDTSLDRFDQNAHKDLCKNKYGSSSNKSAIDPTRDIKIDPRPETDIDKVSLGSKHSCSFEGCGKVFSKLWNLQCYQKLHDSSWNCDVPGCSENLPNKLSLQLHHKHAHVTETSKATYKCHECEKCFFNAASLKSHIRTHEDFPCSQCNKTFSQKSRLKLHQRIHDGEKMFLCQKCPKTFVNSSQLRKHEKIHGNDRKFECFICSESFTRQEHLDAHLILHTNFKPFICPKQDCSMSFAAQSSLYAHLKRHGLTERILPSSLMFKCPLQSCIHQGTMIGKLQFQNHLKNHMKVAAENPAQLDSDQAQVLKVYAAAFLKESVKSSELSAQTACSPESGVPLDALGKCSQTQIVECSHDGDHMQDGIEVGEPIFHLIPDTQTETLPKSQSSNSLPLNADSMSNQIEPIFESSPSRPQEVQHDLAIPKLGSDLFGQSRTGLDLFESLSDLFSDGPLLPLGRSMSTPASPNPFIHQSYRPMTPFYFSLSPQPSDNPLLSNDSGNCILQSCEKEPDFFETSVCPNLNAPTENFCFERSSPIPPKSCSPAPSDVSTEAAALDIDQRVVSENANCDNELIEEEEKDKFNSLLPSGVIKKRQQRRMKKKNCEQLKLPTSSQDWTLGPPTHSDRVKKRRKIQSGWSSFSVISDGASSTGSTSSPVFDTKSLPTSFPGVDGTTLGLLGASLLGGDNDFWSGVDKDPWGRSSVAVKDPLTGDTLLQTPLLQDDPEPRPSLDLISIDHHLDPLLDPINPLSSTSAKVREELAPLNTRFASAPATPLHFGISNPLVGESLSLFDSDQQGNPMDLQSPFSDTDLINFQLLPSQRNSDVSRQRRNSLSSLFAPFTDL